MREISVYTRYTSMGASSRLRFYRYRKLLAENAIHADIHPLLGDGKYGVNRNEKREGFKYQALYAYRLSFDKTDREELLSYLEGRSFSVPEREIWFLEEGLHD